MTRAPAVALACAVVLAGCEESIRLGQYAAPLVDAGSETDSIPPPIDGGGQFVNGGYTLVHGPLGAVDCIGSLQGQEAAFADLTADEVDLPDGEVTITVDGENLAVVGPAIESGFETPQLLLRRGVVPDQPETAVMTIVEVSGLGPADTFRVVATLGLDEATSNGETVEGQSGIVLSTEDSPNNIENGCALTFTATLNAP